MLARGTRLGSYEVIGPIGAGGMGEVFRARDWLRARGVSLVFEGRRRAGCQLAVEFKDPDGNNLEIYWNIDQIGTNSTARPGSEWRPARTLGSAMM